VLVAHGLVKEYGVGQSIRRVIDGLDLEVAAGSFVAVMGPSGSGKSTLLHLLGGLDTPTAGEVLVEGRALSALSERNRTEVRRHRIGFVFQQFNLVPVLTAEENVALPLVIDRLPAAERARRVGRLMELVDLLDCRSQLPAQLSGGEQQRVAVARALVTEPAMVLADEPTGALDSTTGRQVLGLLNRAREELSLTVLVVTHDPAVASAADEVVLLRDGRVAGRHPILGHDATGARERLARLLVSPDQDQ
jgi:putative ABC transport system ATP-binding protein